jgi:hypothetical protein
MALAPLDIEKESGQAPHTAPGHEVGSHRQIPDSGQAVGYPANVVVEPECLVKHYHTGPRTDVGGHRQVSGNGVAGKVQSQVAAHLT